MSNSHVDKHMNGGETLGREFRCENDCGTKHSYACRHDENNNPINEDLICAFCHAEYKNPKLLPCLHTFCKSCLEECVERVFEGSYVKCPLCGTLKKINVKCDDLSACLEGLASDFVALNLLDACAVDVNELNEEELSCSNCPGRAQSRCSQCAMFLCVNCQRAHKKSKQTAGHNVCLLVLLRVRAGDDPARAGENPVRAGDYCRAHVGEELTYYCETCECTICDDCTLLDHPNGRHSVTLLSEVTPTQRRLLAELLPRVRRKVPFLERTLVDIDSVLQSLPDHADAVAREISRTTENLIQALRRRQDELLDELTKLCAHKAAILHEQKARIHSELEILESNCETSEKILRNGSDSEIASVTNVVYKRLEFLGNMKLDIEAEENAEFSYESGAHVLSDVISNTGKVFPLHASPSSLKVIGDGLQEASVGKFASFTLAKSEKCELSPGEMDIRIETPDSVLLACDVTTSGNIYNVVYCPKVPGEHEISVTVRGEHLPDSPVCVNVKESHVTYAQTRPRCLTFGKRGCNPGCFDQPCDVAVRNNGHILVADAANNRIQTFNAKAQLVSKFGTKGGGLGQLSYPSGIALSPHGDVIVSDHGNHRIQAFTSRGVFLWSFGGHGSEEGLMDHPTGIAVDEEGHVVVVDQHNHRVQVFDENGNFLRQFGRYGNENGQFDRPMYVAIAPEGDIVVTDSGNHRVQIFDADGRHRETFGKRGNDDGEFSCPTGITIDAAGYVIVSDQRGGIQVFSPDLHFVTKVLPHERSVEKLDCLMGVDCTSDGKIVVADKGCNNVRVLYP